jgi:hypothetical protein
LNNIYLPILENEFSSDPLSVLDPDVFKNVNDKIEKTYGPTFQKELDRLGVDFSTNQNIRDLNLEQSQRQLNVGAQRTSEDIGIQQQRLQEDKTKALAQNALNYDEVKLQTTNAYRQHGLTFSGLRQFGEKKLSNANDLNVQNLNTAFNRQQGDLSSQLGRSQSDLSANLGFLGRGAGLQNQQAQTQLERDQSRIQGEKTLLQAGERARLQGLGASLLSNPNFYSRVLPSGSGIA